MSCVVHVFVYFALPLMIVAPSVCWTEDVIASEQMVCDDDGDYVFLLQRSFRKKNSVVLKKSIADIAWQPGIQRNSSSSIPLLYRAIARWLIPFAIVLFIAPWVWRDDTGVIFAICSMCIYGIDFFLFAYLAGYLEAPNQPGANESYAIWLCIMTCFVAAVQSITSYATDATYCKKFADLRSTRWGEIIPLMCGPVFEPIATMLVLWAFARDPINSGQHMAVVDIDPLIVGVCFRVFRNEKFSYCQLFGVLIAIGGTVMIGMDPGDVKVILFCLGASMCYAGNIICSRFTALSRQISSNVALTIRFSVLSMLGVLWFVLRVPTLGAVVHPGTWLLAPFVNSIFNAMGLLYLIKSFEQPRCITGINIVIVGANSLIVAFLNFAFLGYQSTAEKWGAMAIILVGIVTISTATSVAVKRTSDDGPSAEPDEVMKRQCCN